MPNMFIGRLLLGTMLITASRLPIVNAQDDRFIRSPRAEFGSVARPLLTLPNATYTYSIAQMPSDTKPSTSAHNKTA
jgi:hypothetical protein